MDNSTVELDFFRTKRENKNTSSAQQSKPLLDRRRSFRDIQGVISKMNPELLKSVIGSRSFIDQTANAATPSLSLRGKSENTSSSTPLTIFYNGTVAVFDVSRDKADNILKIAQQSSKAADTNSAASSSNQYEFPMSMDGDLPIARKKSLQRFLAKREDRVTLVSPYFYPEKSARITALNQ